MTALLAVLCAAVLLLTVAGVLRTAHRFPRNPPAGVTTRQILFPFEASGLSTRALDAALRLARAEDGTLMPVFLALVPRYLPLDAALPRQSAIALSLQEAIEQRALRLGVPIDARIERGRTYRHALSQAMNHERFQRTVIAAARGGERGFAADDVAWLLDHAPGEILVLRPSPAHVDETDRLASGALSATNAAETSTRQRTRSRRPPQPT
jgi:nucleotide-binding universal stress UspA family protein